MEEDSRVEPVGTAPAPEREIASAEDLVNVSRQYLEDQRASRAILSPVLTETSPGVILSRALAGAARIQRL